MTLARVLGRSAFGQLVSGRSPCGRLVVIGALACLGSAVSSATRALAGQVVPCPRVSILSEATDLYRFVPGVPHSPKALISSAQVLDAHMACVADGTGGLIGKLKIKLIAKRGPAGAKLDTLKIPYFIAVTRVNVKVLTRGVYALTIPLNPKTGAGGVVTDDTLTLPLKDMDRLKGYEIIVGIQLTPEELKFNGGK